MAYKMYVAGVLMPITPSKVKVKINNQNKTLILISGEEINILKEAKLTDQRVSGGGSIGGGVPGVAIYPIQGVSKIKSVQFKAGVIPWVVGLMKPLARAKKSWRK